MRYTNKTGNQILQKEDTMIIMEALMKLREFEDFEEWMEKKGFSSLEALKAAFQEKDLQKKETFTSEVVLKLPKAFGGKVYRVSNESVWEYEITGYSVTEDGIQVKGKNLNTLDEFSFNASLIGESIFFTEKEAILAINAEKIEKSKGEKNVTWESVSFMKQDERPFPGNEETRE